MISGLVLASTVGPCSALHQHLAGHNVLQAADIVQVERRGTLNTATVMHTQY